MRTTCLIIAALLVAASASAQIAAAAESVAPSPFAAQPIFDSRYCKLAGCQMTAAFLVADGTAAAPSIALASDVDGSGTGFYRLAANQLAITTNGTGNFAFSGSGFTQSSGMNLMWTSGAVGAGFDTFIGRRTAANVLHGQDSATPIAQTISVAGARGGTDSNVAGVGLSPKINASTGTGTGVPGWGSLAGGALGTVSGTAAHTIIDRLIWNASKTGITNNSATTVANMAVASDTSAGVLIRYSVEVNDGASHHQQVEVGMATCLAINTNGSLTGSTCTKAGNAQLISASGGTLTVTWAATAANPSLIQLTSNTATITPSLIRVTYSIENLTNQAVSVQ